MEHVKQSGNYVFRRDGTVVPRYSEEALTPKYGTLPVSGAKLCYKVRGQGQTLLILQGGAGDADAPDALAIALASEFTVVTYDRRGLSRSPMDNQKQALSVEQHAEDALALLDLLSTGPAFILGTSLGALIGLDLIAHWPERVQTLIAHEPPAITLLSSDEQAQFAELRKEVGEIALQEGSRPALRRFLAAMGVNRDDREDDVEPPPSTREHSRKTGFLLTAESRAIYGYLPDIAALRTLSNKIVPAFGKSSFGCFASRCALALAAQLGRDPTEFPGGHTGYVLRPQAFSETLRNALLVNASYPNLNLAKSGATSTKEAECG